MSVRALNVVLCLISLVGFLYSGEWELVPGTEDLACKQVLLYDSTEVHFLVGNSDGLFIFERDNKEITQISNLPVTGILQVDSLHFYFIVDNKNSEDGVYSLTLQPDSTKDVHITKLFDVPSPTLISELNRSNVFIVTCDTAVWKFKKPEVGETNGLTTVEIPALAFGKKPSCNVIVPSYELIGGSDKDEYSGKEYTTLFDIKDNRLIPTDIKTPIYTATTVHIFGAFTPRLFYTTDSTLEVRGNDTLSTPLPRNEKATFITQIRHYPGCEYHRYIPVIATKSGIYYLSIKSRYKMDFHQIGDDLPGVSSLVPLREDTLLFAGTDHGLYVTDMRIPTAVASKETTNVKDFTYSQRGNLVIVRSLALKEGKVSIEVFNTQGRLLSKGASSVNANQLLFRLPSAKLSDNVYYIKVNQQNKNHSFFVVSD